MVVEEGQTKQESSPAASGSGSTIEKELSDVRRSQLQALYEDLDVDKNGKIDIKELAVALKRRGSKASEATDYAQQVMRKADMSEDASIDFNEFVSYITEHERNLAITFGDLDKNKDGVIDVEEVKRLFEDLGLPRIDDRQAKSIITRMTAGGERGVGLDQFQRYFLLHPSARSEDIAKYWHRGLFIDIGESAVIVSRGDWRVPWWKLLFVGGVAGAMTRTATAPLDRLKTYLQVHASRQNRLGVVTSLRYLIKEGGVTALWRGNAANVAKVVPDSAIKFWAYEQVKYAMAGDRRAADLTAAERFCAGSAAGAFSQTIIYPMEVLKTRLTLRTSGEMNHGMADALRTMYRNEGPRAFFRGYVPTVLGIMPYAGTELAVYETLKNLCVELYFDNNDPGITVLLACGVTSSLLAQVISYPLALVRTRMQASTRDHPTTMRAQFATVLRREGLRGLYRGLVPNFMKALPAAALGYVVFEVVGRSMGLE